MSEPDNAAEPRKAGLPIAKLAAAAVAALIPGSILTLAGGAIFGLAKGTAYVFAAAVLGSVGGFLIARYMARGFVEQRIAGNARFAAVDRAVAENGLKITFLLRLSPVLQIGQTSSVLAQRPSNCVM